MTDLLPTGGHWLSVRRLKPTEDPFTSDKPWSRKVDYLKCPAWEESFHVGFHLKIKMSQVHFHNASFTTEVLQGNSSCRLHVKILDEEEGWSFSAVPGSGPVGGHDSVRAKTLRWSRKGNCSRNVQLKIPVQRTAIKPDGRPLRAAGRPEMLTRLSFLAGVRWLLLSCRYSRVLKRQTKAASFPPRTFILSNHSNRFKILKRREKQKRQKS